MHEFFNGLLDTVLNYFISSSFIYSVCMCIVFFRLKYWCHRGLIKRICKFFFFFFPHALVSAFLNRILLSEVMLGFLVLVSLILFFFPLEMFKCLNFLSLLRSVLVNCIFKEIIRFTHEHDCTGISSRSCFSFSHVCAPKWNCWIM